MEFYYPRKGKSSELPARKECKEILFENILFINSQLDKLNYCGREKLAIQKRSSLCHQY